MCIIIKLQLLEDGLKVITIPGKGKGVIVTRKVKKRDNLV